MRSRAAAIEKLAWLTALHQAAGVAVVREAGQSGDWCTLDRRFRRTVRRPITFSAANHDIAGEAVNRGGSSVPGWRNPELDFSSELSSSQTL
jgi:hypothetical protein